MKRKTVIMKFQLTNSLISTFFIAYYFASSQMMADPSKDQIKIKEYKPSSEALEISCFFGKSLKLPKEMKKPQSQNFELLPTQLPSPVYCADTHENCFKKNQSTDEITYSNYNEKGAYKVKSFAKSFQESIDGSAYQYQLTIYNNSDPKQVSHLITMEIEKVVSGKDQKQDQQKKSGRSTQLIARATNTIKDGMFWETETMTGAHSPDLMFSCYFIPRKKG